MSGANSNQLVQKLLNFRNILRDDGVSTIAYVEQLTCLLFLKMADERKKAGLGEVVPYGLDWQSLLDRDGDELEVHYRHILESLGRQSGTLGTIFRKAQNHIQDPAKLRRLVVSLINEETWTSVEPPSRRWAMPGWSSRARIWRSRRKRSAIACDSRPARMRFSATRCSNSPSERSARKTSPMPPSPRQRTRR